MELVLCLPILLLVMALMINFGTAACWKIRSLSVARHAVWSTRKPRSGQRNPRPDYWPSSATMESGGVGKMPELDDPRANLPIVRGSLPYGASVKENLLNPTRGPRRGSATVQRDFPLLARMGKYELTAKQTILDDTWEFKRMGVWHNWERRIPFLYELPTADSDLVDAYVQAVLAVLYAPFREALQPLDQDDEFIDYSLRFGWDEDPPDFHPRLSSSCTLSHDTIEEQVENLIDRIQGKVETDDEGHVIRRIPSVAEHMAKDFVSLYDRVIQNLDGGGNQAEIGQLQTKIDTLTQFIQGL